MRIFSMTAIAALAVGAALVTSAPAKAQFGGSASHQKVFGYQDENGNFHILNRIAPDTTTPASTGTIEVTITITLKTAVPTGGSVYCGTSLTATSESVSGETVGIMEWLEESSVKATVSGTTAKCTVTTPYSWNVPAASSTVINALNAEYTVAIVPSSTVTIGTELIGVRSSTGPIPGLTKVPATSSTPDKYTVTATL